MLLAHKPIAGSVVVKVDGVQLADGTIPFDAANPLSGPKRFEVTGNTLTFLSATGLAEFRTGSVEVKYT